MDRACLSFEQIKTRSAVAGGCGWIDRIMAPSTCFAGPASKKIGSLTENFSDYQKK